LIVGFGWDIIVLEISFSVESNLIGLNFSIFNISFITYKTNWYIWTYFSKVLVPLIYISIGISWGKIKHNNSTIGFNIVTFSKFSEFLLTSSVPNIKGNFTMTGTEGYSSNLSTFSWNIWLLEVTSIMSLSKCSLTNTTISNKNKFKFSSDILR